MSDFSSVLSNEKGNPKRLPEKFYYEQYTFEDYRYDKINFRLFVVIPYDDNRSTYAETIACETIDLLFSMIKIRERLDDGIFNRKDYYLTLEVNGGNRVDEKTIQLITKWCKKWGYPFAVDSRAFEKPKNKLLSSKLKPSAQLSFSLADFLFSLNELYCLYRIYLVFIEENTSIEECLFISEGNNFIDLSKLKASDYQRLFEAKYNTLVMESFLSFSDNKSYLQTRARSVFDAGMYQLARLTYNREIEIRRCKMCHMPFYPKSGRQKYCNSSGCYPQLYYKHKKTAENRVERESDKEKADN